MSELLPVRGSPGSPYTRKMLALLRFRRIPYRFLQGGRDAEGMPQPKVSLIPIFYFQDARGELTAEVDSTPIIRRLEDEYSGRSVIPADPATAFLNYLLEDYGDEWLTKAMFHYRWYYEPDIEMAGSILPHYADVVAAGRADGPGEAGVLRAADREALRRRLQRRDRASDRGQLPSLSRLPQRSPESPSLHHGSSSRLGRFRLLRPVDPTRAVRSDAIRPGGQGLPARTRVGEQDGVSVRPGGERGRLRRRGRSYPGPSAPCSPKWELPTCR